MLSPHSSKRPTNRSNLTLFLVYALCLLLDRSICLLICDKILHTLCVVALTLHVYSPNCMGEGGRKEYSVGVVHIRILSCSPTMNTIANPAPFLWYESVTLLPTGERCCLDCSSLFCSFDTLSSIVAVHFLCYKKNENKTKYLFLLCFC